MIPTLIADLTTTSFEYPVLHRVQTLTVSPGTTKAVSGIVLSGTGLCWGSNSKTVLAGRSSSTKPHP